jgi:hypothetical protein
VDLEILLRLQRKNPSIVLKRWLKYKRITTKNWSS